MTTTRKNKYFSLLTGAFLLSLNAVSFASDEVNSFSIPKVDDAKVFADLTDNFPAVLNYYTLATEEQIVDFYKQSFGDSINQEVKRGHLTLKYTKENKVIRVVISQQNKKRQVDVIVDKV